MNSRIIEFTSSDGLNLGIMFFNYVEVSLSAYEVRRIALSSGNVDKFLRSIILISFNKSLSMEILWNYYGRNSV
ncbi:MAG: hypothetical protein N2504_05935 [candidate division WOR-3 bacterium]|nr:hypothetical protein [candidate division WOR-3 bacterium]MCX7948110.1 hypothetical protein [candidate division WOR-3 bacterium]MDW8150812.1 hypothetical protein [candidate division WOR-3 bacterium]